jgi:hypothetical protein
VLLVLLHLERGLGYWNFSEGVYALSSRLLLHGSGLYGHVAAAQPPGLYLVGAGVLAVHDGLEWLRFAVGLLQLGAGVIGARIAWRLTQNAWAAAAVPALVLLTPWAVHEHGTLTPEVFGAPRSLGAALAGARRDGAVLAGVLAALFVAFKLPFVIPAALVVGAAARPGRAALAGAVTLGVGGALGLLLFGSNLWEDTVLAQLGTGQRGLRGVAGYWAQGGWNVLAPLLLAGYAGWRFRDLRDGPLARTAGAAALGFLLTFLTNWKEGTGLNILVPVEAALLPLAAAGAWLLVRRDRRRGAVLAGVAVVFTLAQSASLLISPRTHLPFLYPTSEPGSWRRALSTTGVRVQRRFARSCPPGAKWTREPFIAFVAGRDVPDDQPDLFLVTRSKRLAPIVARIDADGPRCP